MLKFEAEYTDSSGNPVAKSKFVSQDWGSAMKSCYIFMKAMKKETNFDVKKFSLKECNKKFHFNFDKK